MEESEFSHLIVDGTLGTSRRDRHNGYRWAEQMHAQGYKVVVVAGSEFPDATVLCLEKESASLFDDLAEFLNS